MTITDYIAKQPQPQRGICERMHGIVRSTFPDIAEEMKWGVPAFGGGTFYIVALRDHVNLGFSKTGLTDDEVRLFDGEAKTMVHLAVSAPDQIDEKRITRLLHLVQKKHRSDD